MTPHHRLNLSKTLLKIESKNILQIIASIKVGHSCKQVRTKWVSLFEQKRVSFC